MFVKVNHGYLTKCSSVFNSKADISLSALEIETLLSPSQREIDEKKQAIATITQPFIETQITSINYLANQGTFHLLFEIIDKANCHYIVKTNKELLPFPSYNFYIDQWMTQHPSMHNFANFMVYTVDCTRHAVPFDFIIMDKVSGNPLTTYKNDEPQLNHYTKQLGESLAKIHNCKTENYGLIDGLKLHDENDICHGTQTHWQDFVYCNLERHIDYCRTHSIIDNKTQDELTFLFKSSESLITNEQSCLLHGDLNDHNIFIINDALTLIDWEDAICGDPIFDIAMWGTFVNHHEKLDILLSGYQKIHPLPINFMVRYWIYYLRIMLAKTVVRHRFQYYKTDKIPAIQRILLPLEKVKHYLFSKDMTCAYS